MTAAIFLSEPKNIVIHFLLFKEDFALQLCYLFYNEQYLHELEHFQPTVGFCHICKIDKKACWVFTVCTTGDNEYDAKKLSEINSEITAKYNPKVLENGSAAYFNKRLYPLINKFERYLRKLIYLKASFVDNQKSVEQISDLEAMDFGEIFRKLFTDDNYSDEMRKYIKKANPLKKEELLEKATSLQENLLWDIIVGSDVIPELRESYGLITDYRNDVMHAHNFDYDKYMKIRTLFEKINKSLDQEINRFINHPDTLFPQFQSQALKEALEKLSKSLAKSVNQTFTSDYWKKLNENLLDVIFSNSQETNLLD